MCCCEEPIGETKGKVIILADHCFPPVVQAGDHRNGDCLAILRIGHGDLRDLRDLLLILIIVCANPRGSMILLATASHLAVSSLDGYAGNTIKKRLGENVEASPIPPIMLGGGVRRPLPDQSSL